MPAGATSGEADNRWYQLGELFFFDRNDWIPLSSDFPGNIVSGKSLIRLLVKPRRGQGAFRALVTNAYGRTCAMTGETTLPVLEAAHIKPFSAEGFNNTFNGLLLRSDFHRLFDRGHLTVTPEHQVVVSARIKEQWFHGKAYNSLHGRSLAILPQAPSDRPRSDLLQWHNDNVFEKGGQHA